MTSGQQWIPHPFTAVNGQPANHIARVNADGTVESTATFNPGTGVDSFNDCVNCRAIQADGKIVLTGQFTLTIGVQKATDLINFNPFPMTAPQTTINAQGKLEFQFSVPDNAAFFRLEGKVNLMLSVNA